MTYKNNSNEIQTTVREEVLPKIGRKNYRYTTFPRVTLIEIGLKAVPFYVKLSVVLERKRFPFVSIVLVGILISKRLFARQLALLLRPGRKRKAIYAKRVSERVDHVSCKTRRLPATSAKASLADLMSCQNKYCILQTYEKSHFLPTCFHFLPPSELKRIRHANFYL